MSRIRRVRIGPDQTNLRVALDCGEDGPVRYMDSVAAPGGRHGGRYGYVWIGDDSQCFGWVSARAFIALADALKERRS